MGFLEHAVHELVGGHAGRGEPVEQIGDVIGHDELDATVRVEEHGALAVDLLPRHHRVHGSHQTTT
jgi:hypothetical protein